MAMESVVISLFTLALTLIGTVGLARDSLFSVDGVAASWKEAVERAGEVGRTALTSGTVTLLESSSKVEVPLTNDGELSLDHFSRWDAILQYRGADNKDYILWLPYVAPPPGDSQWSVDRILFGAVAETFEPGILNPEEKAMVHIKLDPAVKANTTNRAILVTPNGVATAVTFSG
jgi:hypothetical protein